MKALVDPTNALARGLGSIRSQFQVPYAFPEEVLAAAEVAAARIPDQHVDRTDWPFVTLDPATSTDLDQAFTIKRDRSDLLLYYAIADINWFVDDGDMIDVEAWRRAMTVYLPDGKAGLYPPVLSEGAASLLPTGPRPAVIFTVRVRADGTVRLEGAERAIIRSAAKLAYDSVRDTDLPADFADLANRIQAAESRRGAARVDPPEQEVSSLGDGSFQLIFRQRLLSEDRNAALSLAANLAIADALYAHHTGLFRVMAEPDEGAVARLRLIASAFDLQWPAMATLEKFERTLDATDPKQAAFMLAVRRAGSGASYMPYRNGVVPWHAAMAATYVHATAPLRRLADRYVVRACTAIVNDEPIPQVVTEAFARLPKIMARAEALGGQIDRAVIDLAETVMLRGKEGQVFPAVVTEANDRNTRIQLRDFPIVASMGACTVEPGDRIDVELVAIDEERRALAFRRAT